AGQLALLLALWRIDDRPADRTGVEVLADLPELLGHRVDDRVPRSEGGLRRRGAQLRGYSGVPAEHHEEQSGLYGEGAEPARLSWLAVAGDEGGGGQAGAGEGGLGRSLSQRRGG